MIIVDKLADYQAGASAVTVGFFDGVHLGHKALIAKLVNEAKARGLKSVVVTFTTHPREFLHANYVPKLLSTPAERYQLLEACGVDVCVVLKAEKDLFSMSSSFFIHHVVSESLSAKYLLVGHDHHFGCDRENGFAHYSECCGKYGIVCEQEVALKTGDRNLSSSLVRTELEAGNLDKVSEYLGHKYMLSGMVVNGNKVGRSIGFPTANVALSDVRKLVPCEGVYAVNVEIEDCDKVYQGMLYIGARPTFITSGDLKSIEVNIFDFSDDIYKKNIKVVFEAYIRGEMKFDTPNQLAHQLEIDRAEVQKYFAER